MRDQLPEYFRPSEAEFKTLLSTAVIVLDTNVLLNLYRCSDALATELLDLLERFKGRLWMPYSVAKEFLKNRPSVLHERRTRPEQLNGRAKKFVADMEQHARQYQWVPAEVTEHFSQAVLQATSALLEATPRMVEDLESDTKLQRIERLFSGSVGSAPTQDEITARFKEGKSRYDRQIPPGYEDAKKPIDEERYGDFVLWKEILQKAESGPSAVLFVTEDKKEDWWWRANGLTLGPRPELIREFREHAQQLFWIYDMSDFLKWGSKHFDEAVKPEILQEAQERSQASGSLSLVDGFNAGLGRLLERFTRSGWPQSAPGSGSFESGSSMPPAPTPFSLHSAAYERVRDAALGAMYLEDVRHRQEDSELLKRLVGEGTPLPSIDQPGTTRAQDETSFLMRALFSDSNPAVVARSVPERTAVSEGDRDGTPSTLRAEPGAETSGEPETGESEAPVSTRTSEESEKKGSE